jgi:hypothetical protein
MKKLVKESLYEFETPEIQEPKTKPLIFPGIEPDEEDDEPSPFPNKQPYIDPAPKAEVDQVVDKFLKMLKLK